MESHLEIMKGNYDIAKSKLSALKERFSDSSDPKKFDGYNNLMGMANLMSGNAEIGVDHFENVIDESNIYFQYFKIALSYKASGKLEKANKVFDYVAKYNFNGLVYTVVRNKAIEEIKKG